MSNTTDHLDDFARRAFADASRSVSANTHYRLEQASLAAVRAPSQLGAPAVRPLHRWAWFGGGALLASVVAIALWTPLTRQSHTPTPVIADSAAAISTDPNVWSTDLDEDPSMYAWIASKEAVVVSR